MAQPRTPASTHETSSQGTAVMSPSHRLRPYHCSRSTQELWAINAVVKLLRTKMTADKDHTQGSVYVIEEGGSRYVKVGYTDCKELERLESQARECKIDIHRMYLTPGFYGAFRAEQIVHKLLADYSFDLYRCPCAKVNVHREWFLKPYEEIVMTVQLVCNWLQLQSPYGTIQTMQPKIKGKKSVQEWTLKPAWIESLQQWHLTQTTQRPLGWPEFFWRHEEHWKGYSVSPGPKAQGLKISSSPQTPNHMTRPMGHFENTPKESMRAYFESRMMTTELHEKYYVDGSFYKLDLKTQTKSVRESHIVDQGTWNSADQQQDDTSPCPKGPSNRHMKSVMGDPRRKLAFSKTGAGAKQDPLPTDEVSKPEGVVANLAIRRLDDGVKEEKIGNHEDDRMAKEEHKEHVQKAMEAGLEARSSEGGRIDEVDTSLPPREGFAQASSHSDQAEHTKYADDICDSPVRDSRPSDDAISHHDSSGDIDFAPRPLSRRMTFTNSLKEGVREVSQRTKSLFSSVLIGPLHERTTRSRARQVASSAQGAG